MEGNELTPAVAKVKIRKRWKTRSHWVRAGRREGRERRGWRKRRECKGGRETRKSRE